MRRVLPVLLVATFAAGCGSNAAEPAKAVPPQPAVAATAAAFAATPAAAPVAGQSLTGTVLERLDAPPYAYVRLKTAEGEIWVAVPSVSVENGAELTIYEPMLMHNFASKSLERTFDEVYFGMLAPTGTAPSAGANPHTGMAATAPVEVGKVEKASGADARTVAEAWAQKAELAGKTVTVRGKVVKYNPGVMGKNWMHLQDGSGDAATKNNDITVTSMDEVALGDTVTISGTVAIDKDFGAGYVYALIVEEAKVTKN